MKITWETEISELVNVEETAGLVESVEETIERWTEPRIDALELEMTVGGLSKQALVFDGDSPLYDEAQKIAKSYENKIQEFKNFYNEVKEKTEDKRREELLDLQEKVSQEKERMQKVKDSNTAKAAKADASPDGKINAGGSGAYAYYVDGDFFRNAATKNQKIIDELQGKLEQIDVELGKV